MTYRSNRADWTVRAVDGGWAVYYDGAEWLCPPKATQFEATEYADRLARRWPDEGARLMLRWQREESGRQKGGPWRYRYGDESGVIRTRRLADAKAMLRHKLARQRLPNGISWTIEQ